MCVIVESYTAMMVITSYVVFIARLNHIHGLTIKFGNLFGNCHPREDISQESNFFSKSCLLFVTFVRNVLFSSFNQNRIATISEVDSLCLLIGI